MREETEAFFVVWNPDHGSPQMRHRNYGQAEQEARRLAAAHPGQGFIVLQARSLARVADPVTVSHFTFDDVPF